MKTIDNIEKLFSLYKDGVLTKDEFEVLKSQELEKFGGIGSEVVGNEQAATVEENSGGERKTEEPTPIEETTSESASSKPVVSTSSPITSTENRNKNDWAYVKILIPIMVGLAVILLVVLSQTVQPQKHNSKVEEPTGQHATQKHSDSIPDIKRTNAIGSSYDMQNESQETCRPDCVDKICGDDGCGGSCGECKSNHECSEGRCVCKGIVCYGACCEEGSICLNNECCKPECGDRECGNDGCEGSCGVGNCPVNQECSFGKCVCKWNACDGICCREDHVCYNSACCKPQCDDKDCGSDGCGGSCGECPENSECIEHACKTVNSKSQPSPGKLDKDPQRSSPPSGPSANPGKCDTLTICTDEGFAEGQLKPDRTKSIPQLQEQVWKLRVAGNSEEAICLSRYALSSRKSISALVMGRLYFDEARAWWNIGCKHEACRRILLSLLTRPPTGRGFAETCKWCAKYKCSSCTGCDSNK